MNQLVDRLSRIDESIRSRHWFARYKLKHRFAAEDGAELDHLSGVQISEELSSAVLPQAVISTYIHIYIYILYIQLIDPDPLKSTFHTACNSCLSVFNLCRFPSSDHIPPGSPWSLSLLLYTGVLIANKTQANEMMGEALGSLPPSRAITHSSPDFFSKERSQRWEWVMSHYVHGLMEREHIFTLRCWYTALGVSTWIWIARMKIEKKKKKRIIIIKNAKQNHYAQKRQARLTDEWNSSAIHFTVHFADEHGKAKRTTKSAWIWFTTWKSAVSINKLNARIK